MKKVLWMILLLSIVIPVHAANYSMKELIPENTKTTVRGEHLLYKEISYQSGTIRLQSIKNNSKEEQNLAISVGLFDKHKKNIGTVNYCIEEEIASKQGKDNISLEVQEKYLVPKKVLTDIKYIAVLGENQNCRTDGSTEYLGQTVDQIGMARNNTLNAKEMFVVNIIKWIGVVLVVGFLYKFLFTGAYRNIDGEDVRQEYTYINKELRKEREKDAKENPPKPKEVKKNKSDEIIEQERIQNEKDLLDDSDLHNMYK